MRLENTFSDIFKDISSFVSLRDFTELQQLQSSDNTTIVKYAFFSWRKTASELYKRIKFLFPDYQILINKSVVKLLKIENEFENIKDDQDDVKEKRIIINPIDGIDLFCRAIPLFSSSLVVQEIDQNNNYKTVFAYLLNPVTNEEYGSDNINGNTLNKRKITLQNRTNLKSNLCIYDNSNLIVNKDVKTIKFQNFNLALCYMASGKIDGFLTNNINENDNLAGLFIISKSPYSIKVDKQNGILKIFNSLQTEQLF